MKLMISLWNQIDHKRRSITTGKESTTIAIYKTHDDAKDAIKKLQKSGYDMKKLSIIGIDYLNAGDQVKIWGKLGAFWSNLWDLLFGSAFFLFQASDISWY